MKNILYSSFICDVGVGKLTAFGKLRILLPVNKTHSNIAAAAEP